MYINVLQLLIREIYFKILKNGHPNYKYFTEDDVKILKIIKKNEKNILCKIMMIS